MTTTVYKAIATYNYADDRNPSIKSGPEVYLSVVEADVDRWVARRVRGQNQSLAHQALNSEYVDSFILTFERQTITIEEG